MNDARLVEYRKECVAAATKAQDDFDKAVLTLSGGALGVSFAFVKDLIGPGAILHPYFLFTAWLSWALSVACTLISFYSSEKALRRTIDQVDTNKIDGAKAGGMLAVATGILNAAAGVLFIVGVGAIVAFVGANLERVHAPRPSAALSSDAVLTKVYSVGPFAEADTLLGEDDWRSAEQAIDSALSDQQHTVIERVLIVGGVDRRPMSAHAAKRFATNQRLAASRAEIVRGRLTANHRDIVPISTITAGALELDGSPDRNAFARDRRVDVYFLVAARER